MRQRIKQMNFRVYPAEAKTIKRKAGKCGLTVSDYVRNCALERTVMEMPKKGLQDAHRLISSVCMQISEFSGTEKYTEPLRAAQEILLDLYHGKDVKAIGGNEDMAD